MAERLHPLARAILRETSGVSEADAETAARAVLEELNDLPAVEAVNRDLVAFGGGLERSALAASALALARELDYTWNSATSKSMCARALLEAMERLRELAPPKKERDAVDEVAERRVQRRAAAGGARTPD